jgi:hypothetical protein
MVSYSITSLLSAANSSLFFVYLFFNSTQTADAVAFESSHEPARCQAHLFLPNGIKLYLLLMQCMELIAGFVQLFQRLFCFA